MGYIDCVKYPENDSGSDVFDCFIDTEKFIESRLGTPIELPGFDVNASPQEQEEAERYQQRGFAAGILHGTDGKHRCISEMLPVLTANSETDFDCDFSYRVIFDPTVSGDHLYCECIVVVSVATGSGYFTSNYGPDRVYHCPDGLVESGFLDWHLSWDSDLFCERLRERCSAGYCGNASNEVDRFIDKLEKSEDTDPTWKNGELIVTLADGETATFTPYL